MRTCFLAEFFVQKLAHSSESKQNSEMAENYQNPLDKLDCKLYYREMFRYITIDLWAIIYI